jgi:hypothetical protein
MRRFLLALGGLLACSDKPAEPAVDTAAVAAARADSLAAARRVAAVSLDSAARATVATLVNDSTKAVFDSMRVVQPAADSTGRIPPLAVCGVFSDPGRTAPARFVYQSKFALYVEGVSNANAFAELWAKTCVGEVVKGEGRKAEGGGLKAQGGVRWAVRHLVDS